MRGKPNPQGEVPRKLVLEALLELPLGTSLRDVAAHVGRSLVTVEDHVHKLKRKGKVDVIQRSFHKRRIFVPTRLRLTHAEREWLKLGRVTARAVVAIARADKPMTSREVAKQLGWTHTAATRHLWRASNAGLLDGCTACGYTLAGRHPAAHAAWARERRGRPRAGLDPRALRAVQYVVQQGRRVSTPEIARALGMNYSCVKHLLQHARRAGLLESHTGQTGGFEATQGARLINWQETTANA